MGTHWFDEIFNWGTKSWNQFQKHWWKVSNFQNFNFFFKVTNNIFFSTPLHAGVTGAQRPECGGNFEIVKILIENGADLDVLNNDNK